MTPELLAQIARHLLADGKGLLAIDESEGTCNRRFAAIGIAQTEDNRRRWRDLIIASPGLHDSISGVILCDETIHQASDSGVPFVELLKNSGVLIGIKVDTGAYPMARCPGETITEGLDALRPRLATYAELGASFAKWRGVFHMGDDIPSSASIEANAHALARYAALCQEVGLLPVVEPELLMDGDHGLEQCGQMTQAILQAVFRQMSGQKVLLEGMILKPNMVLPGATSPDQPSLDEVADATIQCLLRSVPAAVPGIAFLSGGQSPELASARLNAIVEHAGTKMPWALAFSYARAIQQPALAVWRGQDDTVEPAQACLLHHARANRAARGGVYNAAAGR